MPLQKKVPAVMWFLARLQKVHWGSRDSCRRKWRSFIKIKGLATPCAMKSGWYSLFSTPNNFKISNYKWRNRSPALEAKLSPLAAVQLYQSMSECCFLLGYHYMPLYPRGLHIQHRPGVWSQHARLLVAGLKRLPLSRSCALKFPQRHLLT